METNFDVNNLIATFNKHEINNYIKIDGDKLKINSSQSKIGDFLFIGIIIGFPLIYLLMEINEQGIEYLYINYKSFLIAPVGTFIMYFFHARGNNNFVIDFKDRRIIITPNAYLVRLICFIPQVIEFNKIENFEIKSSSDKNSKGADTRFNYNFYLLLQGKRKRLLFEFAELETKTNKELAVKLGKIFNAHIIRESNKEEIKIKAGDRLINIGSLFKLYKYRQRHK